MKSRSLKQLFEPYADVIIFMVTLLIANYSWKYTMVGDEYGSTVTWFGMDITAPFEFMALHIASAVYWCVSLFRDTVHLTNNGHTILFDSGVSTTIIWGCSGLKQMFIWMCLMLTVRSNGAKVTWLHKLWYIPLGWICCHAFNIFRISIIAMFIEFHPSWFHVLHDYCFKYMFYAMLFGLWVLFVEKIRPSVSEH